MPRGKNPFILVIAIASGAAAFLMTMQMVKTPRQHVSAQAPVSSVVVAARDVALGSLIRREDLVLVPTTQKMDYKAVFDTFQGIVGRVSRRNIPKGEMIKKVDLLAEGDNLAALIPKGYRAMTIPVMLPASITELLQVGNRVDVILTYEGQKNDISSVTLVENARVIGISKGESSGSVRKLDITLAVTPEGAETLAYSTKRGTMNVSIRSFEEEGTEKFFTLKELFFPEQKKPSAGPGEGLIEDKPKVPKDVIEVIRGVHKEQFATRWE